MHIYSERVHYSKQNVDSSYGKVAIAALCIVVTVGILMFPGEVMNAARHGAVIWYKSVMPALLPFIFLTGILSRYAELPAGSFIDRIMKKLFKVNGYGFIVLLSGLIGGFPSGAVIASTLIEKKKINKLEAERLIGFTNICSPMFIAGTVASGFLGLPFLALIMTSANIISAVLSGIFANAFKQRGGRLNNIIKNNNIAKNITLNNGNYQDILSFSFVVTSSAKTAMNAVLNAGCFIIIFSAATQLLNIAIKGLLPLGTGDFSPLINLLTSLIIGILEICNGISGFSDGVRNAIGTSDVLQLVANMAAIGFIAGFSGFSVHMQVISVTGEKKLSLKQYYATKIIQGTILCIMYGCIGYIYFNSSLQP